MSKWKEFKLGDVIDVKHGFAFKGEFFSEDPTENILVTPGNFQIGGGFKSDKFKYYNGEYSDSYILKEGDVIITMTDLSKAGDTLGYSAKVPKYPGAKFLHNQRIGLLQLKDDSFDCNFLYWLLRTSNYQNFIVSSATGTTVKHTSPSRICEFRFKAPPKTTQTAIAEILSSLDDKIELNNQINKNLEALAQALFKQWFVDFEFPNENGQPYKSNGGEMVESELGMIPKGWRVGKLGDVVKIINGYAFKSEHFEDHGEHGIIKIKNVNGSIVDIKNTQFVSGDVIQNLQDKFRVRGGDVLIAMTGAEVGKIGIVPKTSKNLWLNQRVGKFSTVTEKSLVFVLTMFNAYDLTKEVRNSAMGSAQPNISGAGIEGLKCLIPGTSLIVNFSQLLDGGFNQAINNLFENECLEMLRENLLPKLISGELEVQ